MERWVQTCRRELLDRTLIGNQQHRLHALREFEQFYNGHRAAPRHRQRPAAMPAAAQITDPERVADLNIRGRDRLGGILHEYEHAA